MIRPRWTHLQVWNYIAPHLYRHTSISEANWGRRKGTASVGVAYNRRREVVIIPFPLRPDLKKEAALPVTDLTSVLGDLYGTTMKAQALKGSWSPWLSPTCCQQVCKSIARWAGKLSSFASRSHRTKAHWCRRSHWILLSSNSGFYVWGMRSGVMSWLAWSIEEVSQSLRLEGRE